MKALIALTLVIIAFSSFSQALEVIPVKAIGVSECTFPNGTCVSLLGGKTNRGRKDLSEINALDRAHALCRKINGNPVADDFVNENRCRHDFNRNIIRCEAVAVTNCMVP